MANKEIQEFNFVVTPTVDDLFVLQQGGVTYKITTENIFTNIANLADASTLTGGEEIFCAQGDDARKITIDDLADYLAENS